MTLRIVILAAGQGTRMRSNTPKILHPLGGITLLEHVIKTAISLNPSHIYIVYGHGGDQVKAHCENYPVIWIKQEQQLGTANAVLQVLPQLDNPDDNILILYGDVPLIQSTTLSQLIHGTPLHQLGLLTAHFQQPKGLGRIIRNNQHAVLAIVEEKDADGKQKAITEINAGIYVTSAKNLQRWLPQLSANNAQQEFYLTDIILYAAKENISINTITVENNIEVQGVNDRQQLAQCERHYQHAIAHRLLLSGVTIKDPQRFDVRGQIDIANDVVIDINVILEDSVSIKPGSYIGPQVLLRNVQVGNNVTIKANCIIEDAVIADNCTIGPFARIRPGTHLAENVAVGNFVEIKNSQIGKGSKIPHLSYVGDAEFGEQVNFGAGAITCNYNGVKKNKTIIGNNAFIGSDSQLIAPVTIGEGAYIAAGSTINKNAPANQLTLSRTKQQTIENWQRPKKEEN